MSLRALFAAVALTAAVATPAFADTAKPAPAPVAKKDADSYTVELKANKAGYTKGTEGKVTVALAAKKGFHVNPDYPAKIKLQDPAAPGVTYAKKVLTKADGKFEEMTATIEIPFTAANAGKAKVGGLFQFSVCSDKNCFMEKVDLELDVDVK